MKRISHQLSLNERVITTIILLLFLVAVVIDVSQDKWELITLSEIYIEIVIVLLTFSGFIVLWARIGMESSRNKRMENSNTQLIRELEEWKSKSTQVVHEFQAFIEFHFTNWGLSAAEKDVAMLLLKGLNFNEIANIRGTSSNTVRNQAHAIYAKANLTGRNDLAAYFMEELFHSSEK